MKFPLGIALVLFCLMGTRVGLHAQSQDNNSNRSNPPASNSQNPPARTNQQNNQNPFPEDTSDVPVIPTHNSPSPAPSDSDVSRRIPMAGSSTDPVRSPDDAQAAAENQEQNFSSSLTGVGDLLPPADDDETEPSKHNRKGRQAEPEHHETAAEDESVGAYYLDNKAWKAALSRFQSALVLDPDNPDVYWALAEAERHLGQFAEARANYQKVMEYDPGSRHAKEAKKALEDPQIANAKQSQSVVPSAAPQ
jgi:tetratricopeptide (TPR) repeat protein